jgi:outer membrane protein OmpA-like peptidoglycan-associated protein
MVEENPDMMRKAAVPFFLSMALCFAQTPPVFTVTKVERTTKAVTFNRNGSSTLALKGTDLSPESRGEIRAQGQSGSVQLDIRVEKLEPATKFGREYLTYVAWAITPEGRAENLGELVINGNRGTLKGATGLQAFGMVVTAEPYFAVTQPSDAVVLEAAPGSGTRGVIQPIDTKFELLGRGEYVKLAGPGNYPAIEIDPKGNLQYYQALNAIQIAKSSGAEKYAPEVLQKAETELKNAKGFLTGGRDKTRALSIARQIVQTAEDARLVSLRKQEEERKANETAAAEAAKRKAAEEARLRAEADAQARASDEQRKLAEQARTAAQAEQLKAQAAAAEAQRLRADAEKARQEAEAARTAADAARRQAEDDRAAIRNRLKEQLGRILDTRESARGLIVDIGDVNFATGKFDLKPEARERLAKVSGLLIATMGLKVRVEGHTDSVGSDELNQKLSEQRANTVRTYFVESGVPEAIITAEGFGKTRPVAENNTAAGRQKNRRVELVVSGQAIGVEDTGQQ